MKSSRNKVKISWILSQFFAVGLLVSSCQMTQNSSRIEAINTAENTTTIIATSTKVTLPTIHDSPTVTITSTEIVPTPTATEIPCLESSGSIQEVAFPSQLLGEDILTNVYFPPCYNPDREMGYPFLVLLHGQNGNQDQWVQLGLTDLADEWIISRKITPLLIVMPYERQFLINPDRSLYDQSLVEDLLPQLLEIYNVRPEWDYRAIGGLSRGGNWALYIAFDTPQAFGRVGSHSYPGFAGDMNRAINWVSQSFSAYRPAIWVDIGEDDQYRKYGEPIIQYLLDNGIPLQYSLNEGGHTIDYWQAHLPQYLAWYTQEWK